MAYEKVAFVAPQRTRPAFDYYSDCTKSTFLLPQKLGSSTTTHITAQASPSPSIATIDSSHPQPQQPPTAPVTIIIMPGILSNTLSRTRAASSRRSPFHRSISPPAMTSRRQETTDRSTTTRQHQEQQGNTSRHYDHHCVPASTASGSSSTSSSTSTTTTSFFSTVSSSSSRGRNSNSSSNSSLLWGQEIPVPSGTAWGHFVDFDKY
jgi:hypothetical protein